MLRSIVFSAIVLAACAGRPDTPTFAHLRVVGPVLQATHGLRYSVRASELRLVEPTHRTDTFNGHPYEISLAAFVGATEAVLVHAERVADESGASDYSNLPESAWPAAGFRRRSMCVTLAAEDMEGEHDLEWLRANGFDPAGALALEQNFISSADHDEEVVLSLAVKGVDCEDEAAVAAALDRLRARVHVSS